MLRTANILGSGSASLILIFLASACFNGGGSGSLDASPPADAQPPADAMGPTVAPLADSAWPMFRHDVRRSGQSAVSGPSNPPTEQWTYTAGAAMMSSPAVALDGTIYAGSQDHKLHAIHPDGTQAWAFDTGWNVDSSPVLAANGRIYVGVDWQSVPGDNGPDGVGLYALEADGSVAWSFNTGNGVFSSPAIGPDGTIYFGARDEKLYAVSADGDLVWSADIGNVTETSPAIFGDVVYISTQGGVLHAFDALAGTSLWSVPLGLCACQSLAVGADGTIYVGAIGTVASPEEGLRAVDSDGTPLWSAGGDTIVSSPAVATDGTIYVGSFDHNLYALNANGTEKWAFTAAGNILSAPTIDADGVVYVGDRSNAITAINPDGMLRWTLTTGGDVDSSPAIGADGTLYVTSMDGKLYAFK